jgi:hypothetical protein
MRRPLVLRRITLTYIALTELPTSTCRLIPHSKHHPSLLMSSHRSSSSSIKSTSSPCSSSSSSSTSGHLLLLRTLSHPSLLLQSHRSHLDHHDTEHCNILTQYIRLHSSPHPRSLSNAWCLVRPYAPCTTHTAVTIDPTSIARQRTLLPPRLLFTLLRHASKAYLRAPVRNISYHSQHLPHTWPLILPCTRGGRY